MEGLILQTLNFNVTINSSYLFLERYVKLLNPTKKCYFMARYLLELSLVEYKMLKYSSRLIAIAALYLACKIMK